MPLMLRSVVFGFIFIAMERRRVPAATYVYISFLFLAKTERCVLLTGIRNIDDVRKQIAFYLEKSSLEDRDTHVSLAPEHKTDNVREAYSRPALKLRRRPINAPKRSGSGRRAV